MTPAAASCQVAWRAGEAVEPGRAADVAAAIERRATAWAGVIGAFLGVTPAQIGIVLCLGSRLPVTKGRRILLPLQGDGPNPALAHELVHAIAGRSPSYLLNEGLAVHVDASLRLAGPTWPFYLLPPRRWVRLCVEEDGVPSVAGLLAAPPPRHLADEQRDQREVVRRYYLAAGAVAAWLARRGIDGVWPAFRSGRVPGVDAGDDAGADPPSWVEFLGGPLTVAERGLARRSLDLLAADIARLDGFGAAPPRAVGRAG